MTFTFPIQHMEPITKPMTRGITPGSWLSDRMSLQKTVFVCSGCQLKLTRNFLKRHGYVELTRFHGVGLCDGCQEEGPAAMWLFQDSVWWRDEERRGEMTAIRRRDLEHPGNRVLYR